MSSITDYRSLGGLLQHRRGDLSYAKAARQLHVTPRMFKMWEDDYAHPDIDKADRIADWSGVSRYRVLALMDVLTDEEADVLEGALGGYRFRLELAA
jgi:hypothetical protein